MSPEQVHPGAVRASDIVAELRAALERALALGGRPVHRLGSAGTSVTFCVDGEPPAAVTLLLDRHPPVVVSGDEAAEIAIHLSSEQAIAFIRGELILPNEIMSGAVGARGPVRRYLGADPVLRALLLRVRD
jgi:hypothetical protein